MTLEAVTFGLAGGFLAGAVLLTIGKLAERRVRHMTEAATDDVSQRAAERGQP